MSDKEDPRTIQSHTDTPARNNFLARNTASANDLMNQGAHAAMIQGFLDQPSAHFIFIWLMYVDQQRRDILYNEITALVAQPDEIGWLQQLDWPPDQKDKFVAASGDVLREIKAEGEEYFLTAGLIEASKAPTPEPPLR